VFIFTNTFTREADILQCKMAVYTRAFFKQKVYFPIYFLDFKYYKMNAKMFCTECKNVLY